MPDKCLCRRSRDLLAPVCLFLAVLLPGAIPPARSAADDQKPPEANDQAPAETEVTKQQREQRLSVMREHVKEFSVVRRVGSEREQVELRSEPLLRYSDQPRGFVDASLWCWKSEGRPVALAKVEMGVAADKTPFWMNCVASLDDGPISITLGGFPYLSTFKAGFELQRIPRGPMPEKTAPARLRQMKELIGRFAATIHSKHRDNAQLVPEELRLLPSPVYRYADDKQDIRDGVIFALTTNGTNPAVMIVIELRLGEGDSPEWKYGIVNMTADEVHLRLDEVEVWVALRGAPRETWNFFRSRREE